MCKILPLLVITIISVIAEISFLRFAPSGSLSLLELVPLIEEPLPVLPAESLRDVFFDVIFPLVGAKQRKFYS